MSTHARPLADWLAAARDEDLLRLFAARAVRADAPWHDFFDAAEALLDPASLSRVLPALTASEARALLDAASGGEAGQDREQLTALALLRPDGTPYPPVVTAIAGRSIPLPPAAAPASPSSETAAAHAAERAFTTVAVLADLLLIARESPFALLTGGGVSAGEKRQLAEAGVPTEIVDTLAAIALQAGLAVSADRRLRSSQSAEEWLRSSAADRWAVLVTAFRDALPRGVRSAGGGWVPPEAWPFAHPWDPTWAERAHVLQDAAALLGLIAEDGTEPAWAVSLRRGGDAEAEALARLLPAEVDRIFLQNDLTAIAPGPLQPALDVRLRTIAARESAAQASSYRFTSESVAHAFVAGETEASILDFLTSVSLTGIPQPLGYLIAQTAQRHGLVRVSTDDETGRTRIESSDAHLIQAMAVDQSLRPLALSAHLDSLTTRVGRDTVYWALTDARYPATLVGPDGSLLVRERHPAPPAPAPSGDSTDLMPLITRLRSHQGPDADAAWLDRELEAAVRAKSVLEVTVGMPDGSTRQLLLEATGMGGGRLRGRDRAADVERTLPVSSILTATIVAS
ncbi:helicase-associated domain-containing protein [Microbacterium sp.]|nr:helicase-associated domain-containing protein [Microbacterium sp.]MCV0334484.1 helicase-associated domain-containing protein [Microbacterium sp.]MCV0376330.1 helicase-associated domain-containing protein [Microbacterium sp.]MCV0389889.1 helicase-associated domain-containing protein [Microbacterium sp.]MCV0419424.1 helicase-associated domain-containing protein [Microbacterium sp.]MCV0421729.1 helicase-associated domain-containing protein [Microbacterium sp.]